MITSVLRKWTCASLKTASVVLRPLLPDEGIDETLQKVGPPLAILGTDLTQRGLVEDFFENCDLCLGGCHSYAQTEFQNSVHNCQLIFELAASA